MQLVLERQMLHVMDDKRRVALVETKTVDSAAPLATPVPQVRYQLESHLGSAAMELDEAGLVISYEEYHPYGTTSYHAVRSGVEVSAKRYRYTGKERDKETGLYYHGARYYAPWLGRWTSADPAGMVDGPNLYEYVRGNPVRLIDPGGMGGEDPFRSDAPSGVVQFKHPSAEGNFAFVRDAPVIFEDTGAAEIRVEPAKPKAPQRPPVWLRKYTNEQPSAPDWLTSAMAEYDGEGALAEIVALEGTEVMSNEGVWSFLEGAILGAFSGNDSWSATAGSVLIGFIPVVGQIADIRDLASAVVHVAEGKKGAWLELGAAAVGVVPGLDVLKGAAKGATKAGKEVLEEVVEKGAKELAENAGAGAKSTAQQATKTARNVFRGADPDVPIGKQLQGTGQIPALERNPNLRGLSVRDLLSKTPRQLKEELSDKQFKTVMKHFEGRDLRHGK